MVSTVVQTGMVAHLWAQREQEFARTSIPSADSSGPFGGGGGWTGSPRTWFRGAVLYSYHEPIARFVDGVPGPDGESAYVLLSAGRPVGDVWNPAQFERWSVSTSNHMPGTAWHSHAVRAFTVPSIAGRPASYDSAANYDSECEPAAPDHGLNMEFLRTAFHNAVAAYGRKPGVSEWERSDYVDGERVVKPVADYVRESLVAVWQDANAYAAAFDVPAVTPWNATGGALPWPGSVADVESIAAPLGERLARLEAARNTPEAIAKREASQAKAKATKARRERLHYHGTPEERVAEWRAGGPVSVLRYGDVKGSAALLRVKGKKLETSQGASVPLADAVRVYQFVKLCRAKALATPEGTPPGDSVVWSRNGARIPVGGFQVNTIYANGDFVAGCHRIEWPEIVSAATQAGVLNIESSADAVKGGGHA